MEDKQTYRFLFYDVVGNIESFCNYVHKCEQREVGSLIYQFA